MRYATSVTRVYMQSLIIADGNRYQMFFMARGNETELNISTKIGIDGGIWDLYINGILDSAGYDDYAVAEAVITRQIILTLPIRQGYNVFEMRCNGKNPASVNFTITVFGASIQ